MDQITLDRIRFLHPAVRADAENAYRFINKNLLGEGVRLRFAYTFRSFTEQDSLYSQGRTKLFDGAGNRLGIVTNARGGQSIHNYGLAFDIVLLIDKNGDGVFETASWNIVGDHDKDGKADWQEITSHFKNLGWNWGGDWKSFPDYPHFEKTFGFTWKTLQSKYRTGDVFTENIDGKILTWVNL